MRRIRAGFVIDGLLAIEPREVTPNLPAAATSRGLGAVLATLKPICEELPDVDDTLVPLDDIEL